jgi:hypothetical protein
LLEITTVITCRQQAHLQKLAGYVVSSDVIAIAAGLPATQSVIGKKLNMRPQAILKLLIRCIRSLQKWGQSKVPE